ncbi:hypothetical protein K3172_09330 [Qipengyuania sp. 6B39]|uniref:hypothetical protein n=1 Tax=Qipengyuania proteolytica TaxID=2867239 RepID=UPI001C88EB35|nr:hypothetical protein [Qipengyuania proteolytica]MBX7496052.1 hypothetical protein [Qipengyuania proteolytica]
MRTPRETELHLGQHDPKIFALQLAGDFESSTPARLGLYDARQESIPALDHDGMHNPLLGADQSKDLDDALFSSAKRALGIV